MLSRDQGYRKAFLLAVLIPIIGAAGALVVGCNSAFFATLFPPCPLKLLTGFNCLSCGATRATLALVRGDLVTAVYYHPLYIVFLGWLCYLYVRLVISLTVKPYRHFQLTLTWSKGIAILIGAAVFIVFRNTPLYQAVFF